MIVLIILIVLLLLLTLLLMMRIWVILDSRKADYRVQLGRMLSARAIAQDDDIKMRIQFTFWKKDISLIKLLSGGKPKKKEMPGKRSKRKRRTSRNGWRMFRRVRQLLRSFRVRKCYINIDTDDVIANAYLFPIFYAINRGNRSWHINYNGRIEVDILIENRVIRMLYSWIR